MATENIDQDVKEIVAAMMKLTDEQRKDIMINFCKYCGCIQGDRPCQCWNDE